MERRRAKKCTCKSFEPGEREEFFGRQIAVALSHQDFERAQRILNAAKAELAVPPRAPLELTIAELHLSTRIVNGLDRMGILTVRQLLEHTQAEILLQPNFSLATLREILGALAEAGLPADGPADRVLTEL